MDYTFPKKLKMYRKKAHLNQMQLAEKMNLSRSAISEYENGVRYPSIDKVYDMAQILGVSASNLL